jgi:hypothetical protein
LAQKIAGTAFLTVANQQVALKGNFTVSPSSVERTMIAGQDRVHGFQELPRVPWIEGDISTLPGFSMEVLELGVDITVIAQLANRMQYVLHGATCKSGFEIQTRDGQVRVRWEGIDCDEVAI